MFPNLLAIPYGDATVSVVFIEENRHDVFKSWTRQSR